MFSCNVTILCINDVCRLFLKQDMLLYRNTNVFACLSKNIGAALIQRTNTHFTRKSLGQNRHTALHAHYEAAFSVPIAHECPDFFFGNSALVEKIDAPTHITMCENLVNNTKNL